MGNKIQQRQKTGPKGTMRCESLRISSCFKDGFGLGDGVSILLISGACETRQDGGLNRGRVHGGQSQDSVWETGAIRTGDWPSGFREETRCDPGSWAWRGQGQEEEREVARGQTCSARARGRSGGSRTDPEHPVGTCGVRRAWV